MTEVYLNCMRLGPQCMLQVIREEKTKTKKKIDKSVRVRAKKKQ